MARILVAEDERDIRELIGFTLRHHGHTVLTAPNGEEALALALRELPDLVLLDIRMPRLTGYDVCRRLRAEPSTRDIPIAFLSAKGQEAEIQAGMDAGATDYILKPFAPDQLINRVALLLGEPGIQP
ncbi:MAG: response regulator [Chloroflexi bacterium]|nr:response regulator [Chloroflexota bacterium]